MDIIKQLKKKGAKIKYHDTYIPYLDLYGLKYKSCELTPSLLRSQDLVLIITDHSNIRYDLIKKHAVMVYDTRNVFSNKDLRKGNIVKL